MARGRLISRTLGSSRKFAALHQHAGKLGEFAQSLYPLLVASSDDYGRLAGDAFTVKHAVFPTSARREEDFDKALEAMHLARIVRRYDAEGLQLLQIMDFDAHQPGLHKRTSSKFPEPSGNFPEIPSESKRTESKRTESNGIEGNSTALRAVSDPMFERFWEIYPKKRSKAEAEKAWRKLNPDFETQAHIFCAVQEQCVSADWLKDAGQFIPYPASWLNARRWEDVATPAVPTASRQTLRLAQASKEFLNDGRG
jgi:hypothetical protein